MKYKYNKSPMTYLRRIQAEINCLDSIVRKRFLTETTRDSLRNMKESYLLYLTEYRKIFFDYSAHDFYVKNIYNVYIDLCLHIDEVQSA